ncbi:MAG: nucleotidyltransferase [Planctomycetes bacterium]|nr:nucleotidyltransferase [Planctomycetota bacterium]
MSNFFDLLERLVKAGVDFVVVGGFAGIVHGCTYVTQDIDICCDFSSANLLTLQKAVSDLNPVHRMTPNRKKLELTEENCKQLKNLYLDTDIGPLDCLGFIKGVGDYQKTKRVSEVIKIDDMQLHVLKLDALIESKKAMNRQHDKEALLQLEAIKGLDGQSPDPHGNP